MPAWGCVLACAGRAGRASHRLCLVGVALALSACAPAVVRHNEAGNEHFAGDEYVVAADEYRRAQVADPDRAEPYYNAANAYNRIGQINPVEAQTEQALKTADPALAEEIWYNLGNAYFDAEQWPQAVGAYREALRLDPDDVDAKHNLELALQKLVEEQEEEQDARQQNQRHGGDQGQETEDEGTGPISTEQSDVPAGEPGEGEEERESPDSARWEEGAMTEEQAMRLLQTVLADSETLQERLQQYRQFPGSEPEQDW